VRRRPEHEANVPFHISGSDFVEMLVGVAVLPVRDMFGRPRRTANCSIFIEKSNAVGRHRCDGSAAANDGREQR